MERWSEIWLGKMLLKEKKSKDGKSVPVIKNIVVRLCCFDTKTDKGTSGTEYKAQKKV